MDESGQIPYWGNPNLSEKSGRLALIPDSRHLGQYDPSAKMYGVKDIVTGKFLVRGDGRWEWKKMVRGVLPDSFSNRDAGVLLAQVQAGKILPPWEGNPGDVHIDIGSHNAAPGATYDWSETKNPPDDIKRSNNAMMKMLMAIPRVKYAEVGRMGTGAYFYEVEWDNGAITRNERFRNGVDLYFGVKEFARSYSTRGGRRGPAQNPPLPASALMDISTAKTTAREVEAGQRPLGNLGTVDHLLDRGLQKLRGSHLGQVDWENPGPGKIRRYRKPTASERVDRARELQEELIDLLIRLQNRGVVSMEELNLGYRVLFLLKDIPLAISRQHRTNPPATEIYRNIVEIKAIKRDGKRYVHKFGLGSEILGMPDGSILIRSRKGKRLWKNFKVEG